MTTNNISEKQILNYITSTFTYWGVEFISQDIIKSAKKNNQSATSKMKSLLFSLIILHMLDYRVKISECLNIQKVKQQQMDDVILAYLSEIQCPLLLNMQNQVQDQEGQTLIKQYIGCNLESSRNLLIISAWIMAISDYFSQILQKIILKLLGKIQNPQVISKHVQNLYEQKTNSLCLNQQLSQEQLILTYYKAVKSHQYQSQCYKQKKQLIKQKIQIKIKKHLGGSNTNQPINIDELISSLNGSTSDDNIIKQQKQLNSILMNQIQNMNQRKYFWIWMQEKIIKQHQSQLKNQDNHYELLEYDQSQIHYKTKVDLEYLQKYIELCKYYQEKFQQLSNSLDQMKLTIKKSKQIQSQVIHDIKQTLNSRTHQNNKKHLFVALQVKNHLGINIEDGKNNKKSNKNQEKQTNIQKQTQAVTGYRKKLKKQVKKYLNDIKESIKFL